MPKALATQVARRKERDSSQADLFALHETTRSSAPQKARNINICHKRDVLALVEVTAAAGIPLNLAQETKELFPESAHALYDDFGADNPIDSILARLICATSSMSMDALKRAMQSQAFPYRELELKWGTKGALLVAELVKAYDGRRGRAKQTVNVGQMKIEAGGQAVVGNITSGSGEVPKAPEMLPPPKNEDPTPSS
jgi:hypothetical protein